MIDLEKTEKKIDEIIDELSENKLSSFIAFYDTDGNARSTGSGTAGVMLSLISAGLTRLQEEKDQFLTVCSCKACQQSINTARKMLEICNADGRDFIKRNAH